MPNLLEVRDLVKHYPLKAGLRPAGQSKVQAVNGVSFTIPEGTCFGLLGPNGAGKTTTIEMIEGITKPTSGEILFRGKPIGHEFRQRAGIQFQETSIQDYLRVREVLDLFASFYDKTADLEQIIKFCALEEFIDRDSHELSGGQRQRMLLAVALVNDPDIIFLDEPTTGLDPQARRNFWTLVQNIKARGKTVVLTTHYMEEAYVLCDEIAIMDRGKIIAQGKPDSLLSKHFGGVSILVPREDITKPLPETAPGKVYQREEGTELQTSDVNGALRFLLDQGVSLNRIRIRSQTLEDLFLHLTGKELRI